MTDDSPAHTSEKEPDSAKDQLIESIYRIALEPQTYDNFMGHWGEYISQRLGALEHLQNDPATLDKTGRYPEIASHFEIASRLLEQMEHKAPLLTDPEQADTSEPQFLIDSQGRIVWSNATASNVFGLGKNASIDMLDMPDHQLASLREMTAALATPGTPSTPIILKLTAKNKARPYYVYARILPEQASEDIIFVSKVTPDWPDEMHALLTDAFGLSASEIEVCSLIADGQGAAQIAEHRESALATVRTQIKKIMAKTSCTTQSELVRLLHSVMRVAEQNTKSSPHLGRAPERTLYVNLPDRVMPVEQFGDPEGKPVIFFHGMLDGNTMTQEAQALLRRLNLRLICPVRPWFGDAAGTEGAIAQAPERFASDVLFMMDHLRLQQPVLLGHMAGSVYAFALASAAAQGQIKGVVAVSGGVPITALSQFSTMSARQRLVAYTARFTPKMLPFVLRAGISQMESGGDKKFMHSLYETAPHDLKMIADPEIASIVLGGYRYTVRQGHKAFEIDSHQVVNDWSHRVDNNDVPIRAIHGRTDPVVSVESVQKFYESRQDRAHVDVLEDCGQLVLYKHPDIVFNAVRRLMN